MITPDHERAREGAGADFCDSVSLDFCDAGRTIFGLVRISRLPNTGHARLTTVVFEGGEPALAESAEREGVPPGWERARVDGVELTIEEPLARWRLAVSKDDMRAELNASAVSAPLHVGGSAASEATEVSAAPEASAVLKVPEVPEAGGLELYLQLCELSGTIEIGGRSRELRGLGRRVHAWGTGAGTLEGWRAVYAASERGRAISFESIRPAGSHSHGDERSAGHLIDANGEALAFEEARLSTIYGEDGLPRKASLELIAPGDEVARRLGGEAVCGTSVEADGGTLAVSFLRWSIDGEPALGCYELMRA